MMRFIRLDDGCGEIALPQCALIAAGNTDTPGVWQFKGKEPGPTVLITCLIHGNEIAGALACADFLADQPSIERGKLIIAFCNLKAYEQIEDKNKESCRWFNEDMNRVWGQIDTLPKPSDSYELARAKELKAWIDQADVLLDLHSMHTPGPALGLVGSARRNTLFAKRIAQPRYLIADKGHAAGKRLIDLDRFTLPSSDAVAMLVECGSHFEQKTIDTAHSIFHATLDAYLSSAFNSHVDQKIEQAEQILIEVSEAVTIRSESFAFMIDSPNMAQVASQGTCIAQDDELSITTPHPDAWLVMPAPQRYMLPGMTAVRFGRTINFQ